MLQPNISVNSIEFEERASLQVSCIFSDNICRQMRRKEKAKRKLEREMRRRQKDRERQLRRQKKLKMKELKKKRKQSKKEKAESKEKEAKEKESEKSKKSEKLLRSRRAATARPERIWDYGVIPYEIEANFSGKLKCVLSVVEISIY